MTAPLRWKYTTTCGIAKEALPGESFQHHADCKPPGPCDVIVTAIDEPVAPGLGPLRCLVDDCKHVFGDLHGLDAHRLVAHPAAWVKYPGSAVKADSQKNRLDLLSPLATEGLGLVLTHGAAKYADHNWRKGMNWSRLIGAAKRHLSAFERGENIDPESGLPHLDHLAACVHFLSEYQKTNNGTDDRWVKP